MSKTLNHVHDAITFHQAFEWQAEMTPRAASVTCEHVGLTFEQLNTQANRLAHRLIDSGVAPGSRVGLIAARDPDTVAAMLGIMKTGAAFVLMDPAGPRERLAYMVRDGAIRVFVTPGQFATELPACDGVTIRLDEEGLTHEDGGNIGGLGESSDAACLLYISNASGKPRAVTISHRSLLDMAIDLDREVYSRYPDAALRIGLKAPISITASIAHLTQILFGRWLHILPDRVRCDTVKSQVGYLFEYGINVLDCAASDICALLDAKLAQRMPPPAVVIVRGDSTCSPGDAGTRGLAIYGMSCTPEGAVSIDIRHGESPCKSASSGSAIAGEDLVDIHGFPVALGEVEGVLLETALVTDACATAMPADDGIDRIVAYIVPNSETPSDGELRMALRSLLPEYMIPGAIVRVSSIPRDRSGSAVLHGLPAPSHFERAFVDGFVSPRNRVEDALADMCAHMLGAPRVGVFDNFFELGGHSLLATQFIGQIQDYFPSEEPLLSVFFQNPTIAALSAAILNSAADHDVNEIADVLARVMNMSDDEVEAMLADGVPA